MFSTAAPTSVWTSFVGVTRGSRGWRPRHLSVVREHDPGYDVGLSGEEGDDRSAASDRVAAASADAPAEHRLRGDEPPFQPDLDPSRFAPPPTEPGGGELPTRPANGSASSRERRAELFAGRRAAAAGDGPRSVDPNLRGGVPIQAILGGGPLPDADALLQAGRAAYGDAGPVAGDGPPFGLPILEEVPELAAVLTDLRQADRLYARSIEALSLLMEHDVVPSLTGLSLQAWLSAVGRRTGSDIRMLRQTVKAVRRFPALRAAFGSGVLSWAQVRILVLETMRLPAKLDADVDLAIDRAVAGAGGAEPDDVVHTIRQALTELDPTEVEEAEEHAQNEQFMNLQPRLDGSGGNGYVDAGTYLFSLMDRALSVPLDGLPASRDGFAGDPLDDGRARRQAMRAAGAARARRLETILETWLAIVNGEGVPGGAAGGDGSSDPELPRSVPKLLLRWDLNALCDRSRTPASVLTSLLGGRVRLSAAAARRLLDERGADLRSVIVDEHGSVVGVGRATRRPPGWIRDMVLAMHDTCAAPTCDAPALTCQLDHATPWFPHRPDAPYGRTDIDQLAPLCSRDNAAKERAGWTVTQLANGVRRWRHERSGVETTTLPATWRPPPGSGPAPPGSSPPSRAGPTGRSP